MTPAPEQSQPQFSVGLRNYAAGPPDDWRHLLDQARAADDAGVDRVFVSDHLAFGPDLTDYADPARGGRTGGVQPTGPDGDWLEALTVLAAMAGVTSRVQLATNVLVAPLRPPVLLAKMAATLDALSHGRFELGVGVGWQRAEYDASGVSFERRGRLLDETLSACRELWTAPAAGYRGEYVSFSDLHMMPKPVGGGGVPVWIGGGINPAVARRLADRCAGWIPWGIGVEVGEFVGSVRRMREMVERSGGVFDAIRVAYPLTAHRTTAGGLDLDRMFADTGRLIAAGVTDFRTLLRIPPDPAAARNLLDALVAAFRKAGR